MVFKVFGHILDNFIDGGLSWSCPIDLTPSDNYNGQQECVFGHMNKIVDDKLMLLFQRDFEPGLSVRGDNDMISQNEIVYLECNVSDIFVHGCTDPSASNYSSNATIDNGLCIYTPCTISNNITSFNPSDTLSCDGTIIVNSSSTYPISSYKIFDINNNLFFNNNFAVNLCNEVYIIEVTDSIGCKAIDTLVHGIISGCTDTNALNYNQYAVINNGSCLFPAVYGCTNPIAINYNSLANTDDGSCQICDLTYNPIIQQNTPGFCDGYILVLATSSHGPVNYHGEMDL